MYLCGKTDWSSAAKLTTLLQYLPNLKNTMTDWIVPLIAILGASVVLGYSADRLVTGAAALAKRSGVSTLVIGATVVALGTSAPEIVVSAIAALTDSTPLAIGNALGSNIANIGLVLGMAALFTPIVIQRGVMRRDIPLMLLISVACLLFMIDGYLSFLDGIGLMVLLVAMTIRSIYQARKDRRASTVSTATTGQSAAEALEPETTDAAGMPTVDESAIEGISAKEAWWLTVSGLVLLVISSRVLVWGAVDIATLFGVSELIIGLTIVAIGTSLPELAATVAAARRHDHDMAIGGIVGSHIYNLLAVIGIAALLGPSAFDSEVLTRDYPAMLLLLVLLWGVVIVDRRKGQPVIGRVAGVLLLSGFVGYIGFVATQVA